MDEHTILEFKGYGAVRSWEAPGFPRIWVGKNVGLSNLIAFCFDSTITCPAVYSNFQTMFFPVWVHTLQQDYGSCFQLLIKHFPGSPCTKQQDSRDNAKQRKHWPCTNSDFYVLNSQFFTLVIISYCNVEEKQIPQRQLDHHIK